jgi:cell division septation protein DedD
LNYPGAYAEPAPSYQSPQPGAAPGYQSSQRAAPGYDTAPHYQATDFGGQAYQPVQPASFRGADQAGSQPYQASSYDSAQDYQSRDYQSQDYPSQDYPSQDYQNQDFQSQPYPDRGNQDQGFADASFPEASFPEQGAADANFADASFPDASFDQNFADPNFANQNFAKPGFADAGFTPQQQHGFDANFPEQVFPNAEPRGHQDRHGGPAYRGPDRHADHGFEPFAEEAAHAYGEQAPKSDPRRQLQAFDAIYDQPPQVALGSTEPARRPAQDFYESERLDADFLDGAQLPPPGTPAKSGLTLRSRSAFMVGSALLGAIALGGALAFAYKQSGGGLGSEPPPLVQADATPVKAAPDQPGGKEFPHKNKLIYDRLQNGDAPESEKLVPRQEDVAVPAMPASDPASMPAPVASTDAVPPTTQALPGAPTMAMAAADETAPDGGPRKVKTIVVRPDGSVETPQVPALPTEAAPAGAAPLEAAAAPAPAAEPQLAAVAPPQPAEQPPVQAAPQEAAAPAPAPEPKPKPKQQTAAATPQAAPSKYVVQVGSKKNQTEALASFADMQQKYPTLLASYRPIVQKADLGAKGTWYRLRIGPITDKTAASKLCSQLKSQGLPDCLVMAQ